MSLQRKIFSGVAVYTIDTVIGNLACIASVAFVFRYLTLAEYGTLALVLSYYGLATAFLDFGLGAMFASEIAQARGAENRAIEKLFTWGYMILVATMGSILFAICLVLALTNLSINGTLWIAIGSYVLLTATNNAALTIFLSHANFRQHVIQSIVRVLSRLVFLISLPFWWQGNHLTIIAWSHPIAEGIAFMVSMVMLWNLVRPLWTIPLPLQAHNILWESIKKQGIFVSVTVPIKKIQEQLPIWILMWLAGKAATGAFAAASGGYGLVFAFFRSVETTVFPLVSEYIERDQDYLKAALQRTQKYSLWLAILAVFGGWIAAGPMIHILAGDQYADAISLFRVLIPLLLVYVFGQVQRPILYALKAQRLLFYSHLIGVAIYVIVLTGGTLIFGVIGATFGVVVVEAIIVYLRYSMVRRLDPHLQSSMCDLLTVTPDDWRLWTIGVRRLRSLVWRKEEIT